jgi:4-hydroxy-tetrahydrodipicolinate synthase
MHIRGIVPAVITPFTPGFEVAWDEYQRLLAFLIDARVHGLFVVGNAGEFYALSEAEKQGLLAAAIKTVGGRVPVYFGSGAASTHEAIRLTRMAEAEGAAAVSVISPWIVKASDDELFAHYRAICESTRLPVLVYNNPPATGNSVSPALMKRLAAIDNMAGIKDSCGDLAVSLEFIRLQREGFSVLAGRDGLILSTLVHGGRGAISSVASACPELAVSIYEAYVVGDLAKATEAQLRFAELRQLFQLGTFPSVVKAALEYRGFAVGSPRPPVAPLSPSNRKVLESRLAEVVDAG